METEETFVESEVHPATGVPNNVHNEMLSSSSTCPTHGVLPVQELGHSPEKKRENEVPSGFNLESADVAGINESNLRRAGDLHQCMDTGKEVTKEGDSQRSENNIGTKVSLTSEEEISQEVNYTGSNECPDNLMSTVAAETIVWHCQPIVICPDESVVAENTTDSSCDNRNNENPDLELPDDDDNDASLIVVDVQLARNKTGPVGAETGSNKQVQTTEGEQFKGKVGLC